MKKIINNAINISRSDIKPNLFKLGKLQEEGGELAQAVLYNEGFLPHKTMKEPLVGEVADVMLVTLDVYRASYPNLSNKQLIKLLKKHMKLKSKKWKKILHSPSKR